MKEMSILEYIEERLDHGGIDLPIFDPVALKLQRAIAKDDFSAAEIADIIRQDQSLATQTLKMANSAFYKGLSPAKTIRDAIVRVGIKGIVNFVMAVTQEKAYHSLDKRYGRWMNPLWTHSLCVAMASKWLANHLGFKEHAEECFLAGLIHDIGKLLLLKIIQELQSSDAVTDEISSSVIDDVLETMHCPQGERLMRHLNMPEFYCEVVLAHDQKEFAEENVPLNLVKMGNMSCHKLGIGLVNEPDIMLSVTREAIHLMASDTLLAQLQVELEMYDASIESVFGIT